MGQGKPFPSQKMDYPIAVRAVQFATNRHGEKDSSTLPVHERVAIPGTNRVIMEQLYKESA
jgi:hypothetical protein